MSSNTSLSFITENSPAWIDRLDDLTSQIATRQLELRQLAARPLKQRHGSTESLRPKANLDDVETRLEQHSPELVGQAKQYQAQVLRRKRKTGSIASNGSGTSTYRTRSMIIVYYDSAVQEAFEMIVRNIGTARNNIRKGKMAAKMKQMTAVADNVDSDPDSMENFRSRIAYTRTTRPKGSEVKTVFDQIDLGLDFSQAQCERAAHQFLREGDCAEEIMLIRNKMVEITQLAAKELDKEKEAERKQAALDAKLAAAEPPAVEITPKVEDPPEQKPAGEPPLPGSGPLEVDPNL